MYVKGTIRDTVLLTHLNILYNLQGNPHKMFFWGKHYLGPPTKEKQHADFISHYKENKLPIPIFKSKYRTFR
jgi:hypothetical protein